MGHSPRPRGSTLVFRGAAARRCDSLVRLGHTAGGVDFFYGGLFGGYVLPRRHAARPVDRPGAAGVPADPVALGDDGGRREHRAAPRGLLQKPLAVAGAFAPASAALVEFAAQLPRRLSAARRAGHDPLARRPDERAVLAQFSRARPVLPDAAGRLFQSVVFLFGGPARTKCLRPHRLAAQRRGYVDLRRRKPAPFATDVGGYASAGRICGVECAPALGQLLASSPRPRGTDSARIARPARGRVWFHRGPTLHVGLAHKHWSRCLCSHSAGRRSFGCVYRLGADNLRGWPAQHPDADGAPGFYDPRLWVPKCWAYRT